MYVVFVTVTSCFVTKSTAPVAMSGRKGARAGGEKGATSVQE
jgi:hypothetical protein